MTTPAPYAAPKPPANVAPYVDILGVDLAVEFLLKFGGAELYHPDDPKGGSQVAKLVGLQKARKLASASPVLKSRVPIPKAWIAQVLYSKSLPVAQIARTLHVSDVTVRSYLKKGGKPPPADTRQPSLF